MADRYDALAWKKSQSGKPYAVRIGSAVPRKQGEGMIVYLDAMPAPENGQYVITLSPPRPREGGGSRSDEAPW